jgi:hypothetical protein
VSCRYAHPPFSVPALTLFVPVGSPRNLVCIALPDKRDSSRFGTREKGLKTGNRSERRRGARRFLSLLSSREPGEPKRDPGPPIDDDFRATVMKTHLESPSRTEATTQTTDHGRVSRFKHSESLLSRGADDKLLNLAGLDHDAMGDGDM